jgi:hypothetical protein
MAATVTSTNRPDPALASVFLAAVRRWAAANPNPTVSALNSLNVKAQVPA